MSVVTRRVAALSTPRARAAGFVAAVSGTALLGAVLSHARPTGLALADDLWGAALVAAVAYLAGTARRWTWVLPAGVAAALGGGVALACAAPAIAIGFWSVLTDTRSRARGALVGGLGTVALLCAEPLGITGLTTLLATAAIVPVAVSGYRHSGRRGQRRVRRVAAVTGVVMGLVLAGGLLGFLSVGDDLTRGARLIDDGLAAARDTDDDLASAQLGQASRHLSSAESTLSGWFVAPARLLPVVGPNLEAVDHLAHEAGRVAEVSSFAAASADVDELRFVGGRIDTEAVAAMEQPLEDTVAALEGLRESVDTIRSPWLVAPLGERLDRLRSQLADVMPDAGTALTAVRMAPDLLGANGTRHYLVLFVTPVEARGRTGFPGNFAELQFEDGRLTMPRFGRISELEQGGLPGDQRTLTEPPDFVARYGRFDPATTWRNITMAPDFPSVAVAAGQLYPQSGGREVDGVMAIDPTGLAGLLRYTGPVEVAGLPEPLDADNAAQFLQLDQYVRFTDVSQRVDVLEEVARTTFERLTEADLPSPRAVSDQLDPLVDGGHIQFTTLDTNNFLLLDSFGVAGRLGDVYGDFLAVTSSNAAGSKIDLFLERSLHYQARWDPETGRTTGTITASLTNAAPASGLPDYVIGNVIGLPTGTNRSYVSIYTPLDATAARLDGQPLPIQSQVELDRNVYSTFVTIPPGGTVTIELDVDGVVPGSDYRLDLAQQPLVRPEQVQVDVEVAGDRPFEAPGGGVDGRVGRWFGPLTEHLTLGIELEG